MSHLHERKEKVCLNCGADLIGRYCQDCGQENVEPKQSLWHLIVHFFNDFTHFDGKLFSTLKLLLFKPGFLSREYVMGRRISYLDPIRMYIFISAVFLFFILSLIELPEFINIRQHPEYKQGVDSLRIAMYENDVTIYNDEIKGYDIFVLNVNEELRHGKRYYDSVTKAQPDSFKTSLLEKYFVKRFIGMYQAYDIDPYNFIPKVIEKFVHSFSKIFFISLPFLIFLLWLFYIRRRKQFYIAAHSIFALHYYCVCFIVVLILAGLYSLLEEVSYIDIVLPLLWIIALYLYLYIAMRRFYNQGWIKTLIKSLLIYTISAIFISIVTLIMFLNSFLSMDLH